MAILTFKFDQFGALLEAATQQNTELSDTTLKDYAMEAVDDGVSPYLGAADIRGLRADARKDAVMDAVDTGNTVTAAGNGPASAAFASGHPGVSILGGLVVSIDTTVMTTRTKVLAALNAMADTIRRGSQITAD